MALSGTRGSRHPEGIPADLRHVLSASVPAEGGDVKRYCPVCTGQRFHLYGQTVTCEDCDYEMGDMKELGSVFPGGPFTPPEVTLLGREVEVVLDRDGDGDGESAVARGKLLRVSAMGEVVLADEMGDVLWCWPALEVRAAGTAEAVRSGTGEAESVRAVTDEEKRRVMRLLWQVWRDVPELRLGQLIANVLSHGSLHAIEDFQLAETLRATYSARRGE
jgi:hypothetical protein